MKRKVLILPLVALLFGLASCNQTNDHNYQLYRRYVATLNNDEIPSYEEWLESIKGEDGQDADAPKIAIGNDDHYYINDVDTGIKTTGEKGETGETGPQGQKGQIGATGDNAITPYELYLSLHPDYQKSESEWYDELANGLAAEQIYHTIIFDTNGGSDIGTQRVLHGDKIIKPANPSKEGFTFTNWSYENETWNFNASVTVNMVLVANYI